MNDCKKYLSFYKATNEDKKYENIELITVEVNGWPRIFGIAIKNIPKDMELLTDYGSSYVGVKQQRMRYNDNMTIIDNKLNDICIQFDIDLSDL